MSKRRRFSGELKAKIALEALQGDRTLQEIAARYQVHPNQVGAWKRQAIEGVAELFSKGAVLGHGRRSFECPAHRSNISSHLSDPRGPLL